MPKRWRMHLHDSERVERLAQGAQVPAFLAQLLLRRGLDTPERVAEFLAPRLTQLRPPEQLPGCSAAAERLAQACAERRRIVVYGDYDVDGMTGASLLWQCLRLLQAPVTTYVPHRLDEGYGLHAEAVAKLAADGAQTIVTVDCGITSTAAADAARALGVELIITDHHTPGDALPDAAALVHPALPGHPPTFTGLSGAGVAFKLAWALCQQASGAQRVSERFKSFLVHAVGLAALGAVADVVPLVDDNRILVLHGLAALHGHDHAGVQALLRVAKLSDKSALSAEDLAFGLAPRLNAAGRLGQAQLAVELLTTAAGERAQSLAEYIDQLNGSRQSLEQSVYLAAHKQALACFDAGQDAALVLAGRGWHVGVIGIVAGRLAERFHRPVVLLALDPLESKPAVGSARSVPGFDLHQALKACAELLVSFGGHAQAAGLKIEESRLSEFQAAFCEHVAAERGDSPAEPELWIDTETPLASLSLRSVELLERLAPFGPGNPRPLLCATDVELAEPARKIGGGERHLALKLRQHGKSVRAVAFGGGEWAAQLQEAGQRLHVAFRPVINEYRGHRNVELHVCDWQDARETAAVPLPSAARGL